MLSPRTALLVVTTLVGAGLAVPLTAGPAAAAVPAPVPVTQTAARNFGNGGPATQASVEAGAMTVAADGATVFYDRKAHQVRRVDPATSIVSVLAGTGTAPTSTAARCALAEGVPATEVPIDALTALWAGADGDLFASPGYQDACRAYGDVYRLDHLDQTWHRVLKNPPTATCCSVPNGIYTAVGVEPDGDVYAFDSVHAVIRRIASGSAPTDQGVIVAGTLDSFGRSGDGGPATSAQLEVAQVLAVGADGSLTFTSGGGTYLRRVDAAGTISRIAGSGVTPDDLTLNEGVPATDAHLAVVALTVSGTDIFLQNRAASGRLALQAFPVGGAVRTVVGPAATCYLAGSTCPGPVLAARGSDLLVANFGSIRRWPSDGSAKQSPGVLFAGLDDGDGVAASPDGVPLSSTFLPNIRAVATAPDGSFALATPRGIRVLRGLTATDTLSTLSTVEARTLDYTSDGTLFATVLPAPGGPLTVATISPAGVVTTVLGGGSDPVADGALGTSVALPHLLVPTLHTAVDRDTGTLYFAVGTEHLWSLDPATGVVHLRAGDGSAAPLHDGANATTSSLAGRAPSALAVGSDHSVHVAAGIGMLRLDPAGTLHVVDCPSECPSNALTVAPDGNLLFPYGHGLASRGPDGTVSQRLPGLTGPFAVLPDGRIVAPTFGSGGGGLLTITDPPPTPVYPDPLPAVQVTPGPASITVSVTPAGDSPQRLRVYGTEVPADGSVPGVATLLSDSYGESSRTFYRLAAAGSSGPPLLHGHTYRITVLATEADASTRVVVTSAPQRYDVQPAADDTAPGAPTLSLASIGGSVRLTTTLPADPDADRVVVRKAVGTQPPTSPTDGLPAPTAGWGRTQTGDVPINPLEANSFAAFALDTSGNVSSAASVVRPAAALIPGDPVANLSYLARAGATDIRWQERFVPEVRYAAGTTPPATMTAGTPVSQVSTADGTGAQVPVANGAKVAVSIFDFADYSQTTYRRVSFVLTGGQSSDSLTVAATPTVTYGQRPAVSVSFQRRSPTGAVLPRSGANVVLFRRPAGTSTWLLVAGTYTGSTGRAAFTVPVPTGAVDYQVRGRTIDAVQIVGTRRTTVRQIVSANLSATTVRRGSLVTVSGAVTPRRAVRVSLQRYVSGRWVTLTSVVSSSTGSYRIAYRPAASGSYVLRVLSPASVAVLATGSPNRTLRVT